MVLAFAGDSTITKFFCIGWFQYYIRKGAGTCLTSPTAIPTSLWQEKTYAVSGETCTTSQEQPQIVSEGQEGIGENLKFNA